MAPFSGNVIGFSPFRGQTPPTSLFSFPSVFSSAMVFCDGPFVLRATILSKALAIITAGESAEMLSDLPILDLPPKGKVVEG